MIPRCHCCDGRMILLTNSGLRACWYCDQGERSGLDLDWVINGQKSRPYDWEVDGD